MSAQSISHRLPTPAEYAEMSVAELDSDGFAHLPLGELGLDVTESLAHAIGIMGVLRDIIAEAFDLPELRVEPCAEQLAVVAEGSYARTLLPHHDSGHTSYLTPTRAVLAAWDPSLRRLPGVAQFSSSGTHKLYHGLLVIDPGSDDAATGYLDLPLLLRRAHRHQHPGREADPATIMAWLGEGITLACRRGLPYVPFGLLLGLRTGPLATCLLHQAEVVPEAVEFAVIGHPDSCACTLPGEKVLCSITRMTTGMTFQEVRDKFEHQVIATAGDLIVGHNLRMLHSGLRGRPGRRIRPLYLSLETPDNEAYEGWLQRTAWCNG